MAERANLIGELWALLKQNKKWWLLPMLLIFAVFAALVLFSGSPIAPFIYTLF